MRSGLRLEIHCRSLAVPPAKLQRSAKNHYRCIGWKNSCTSEMTAAPSPTAEATRLIEPDLTSPTAKTPGMLQAWRPELSQCWVPVWIKPAASRSTHPPNHSVFGSAPSSPFLLCSKSSTEPLTTTRKSQDRDPRAKRSVPGETVSTTPKRSNRCKTSEDKVIPAASLLALACLDLDLPRALFMGVLDSLVVDLQMTTYRCLDCSPFGA